MEIKKREKVRVYYPYVGLIIARSHVTYRSIHEGNVQK